MRLLLLLPKTTYRADDFLAAADRMGVDVTLGSDRCHQLEDLGAVALSRDSVVLDFLDPVDAARRVVEHAKAKAIDGIVATDDATTEIAARAAAALGLPHNPPEAARASRDKLALRERLAAAGVPQARFRVLPVDGGVPRDIGRDPGFPCVLKPRALSASRGVMRADDPASFAAAFARVARLLADPEIKATSGDAGRSILVESFLPGREVALEGLLVGGALTTLALFDKPDPLDGPFFEETLYVTPSRLPEATQRAVSDVTARGCAALGLVEGPVHAELRVDDAGSAFVLEIAARSIGGLCARTLRFGTGMSLEEVVIRHALTARDRTPPPARERGAAGVLMLPIPRSGVFRGVDGVDAARAVPGIEEITITALPGRELLALPEGHAYLGFAIARGATPEQVEASLRAAQALLAPRIAESIRVAP